MVPDGREMDDSKVIKSTPPSGGLRSLGTHLPGASLSRSQTPVVPNGHLNQINEETEVRNYGATNKDVNVPRSFRIGSMGSSEYSSSVRVDKPVICIQDEDDDNDGEGYPLYLSKSSIKDIKRLNELAGMSLPSVLSHETSQNPTSTQVPRGASVDPGRYGSIAVSVQEDPCPSPTQLPIRKTISGELMYSQWCEYAVHVWILVRAI